MGEIRVRTDGPSPAKKRRIAASPKQRTTERIDLEDCGEAQQPDLVRLLTALRRKKRIVVIAGAGISVSAGSMQPPPQISFSLQNVNLFFFSFLCQFPTFDHQQAFSPISVASTS